jgi:RNA polymerase sigma factor (sigma-70 family)
MENRAENDRTQWFSNEYDFNELLQKALAKLTNKDRQVILWRYSEGRGIDEISQLLDINKKSTSNRVYRCMELLRKEILELKGKIK